MSNNDLKSKIELNGVKLLPVGDCALLAEFGREVDSRINARVRALTDAVLAADFVWLQDVVPAFASLLICFDKGRVNCTEVEAVVRGLLANLTAEEDGKKRVWLVPVCYEGEFAPDMADMERLCGLSREEIVAIHSGRDYQIYMLGFLPGFPYLGGLDERIHAARLDSPRVKIEAGSVGIGGAQTGIYPCASPGGWRLIGKTPAVLYDPERDEPIVYQAGDYIRFVPISAAEFAELAPLKEPPQLLIGGADEGRDEVAQPFCRVLHPGALTTVQDKGRFGYQQFGIGTSGAMDESAAAAANYLVGNDENAALLEMTVAGVRLEFLEAGQIALTGADMGARLNGEVAERGKTLNVQAGDVLQMGFATNGCRGYLAFGGGIAVPEVMGSRATNLKCGLGGLGGRALKAGDEIAVYAAPSVTERQCGQPNYAQEVVLRCVPGPQEDMFTERGLATFYGTEYVVSTECDRMGYRLDGEAPESVAGTDIVSDGIAPGAVQVTNAGLPIVLMADRQTTGGYAKIATVISEDLWKLAQCLPGAKVRFEKI